MKVLILMKQRKLKSIGNPRLIANRVVERKRRLRICMFTLKLVSRFTEGAVGKRK